MELCNYLFEPCWISLTLSTLLFIGFQTVLILGVLKFIKFLESSKGEGK